MKKVLIASNNLGKIREIAGILAELDIAVVGQKELGVGPVEETGVTFIENALIKARYASAQSGLPALADDSGLEVDALDGRPGVYSARFAGPDATDAENNRHLMALLKDRGPEPLTARFRCVMVFLRHHWSGGLGGGDHQRGTGAGRVRLRPLLLGATIRV